MASRAERVYERMPVPVQNALITAYGYTWRHLRMGGRFREYRQGFLERGTYNESQWESWQTARLRQMLAIAWESPRYRQQWEAAGVASTDLATFTPSDLTRLPVLQRDDVRTDPGAYCPGGQPGKGTQPKYSSGSTGTPLTVYYSDDDFRRSWALRDARYYDFCGIDYTVPRATLSGRIVKRDNDFTPPFHRYNAAERQVYCSVFHLTPETAPHYLGAMTRYGTKWLTGYANQIHDLARYTVELGLTGPRLLAVIPTSEPVFPQMREAVKGAFGCKVTEEYGLIEQVCFALECEEGSLHLSPDAGIVEILDDAGNAVAPGKAGEIVATGFLREAQPLIRYPTGDRGILATEPCSCGRQTPIFARLDGRVTGYLLRPNGTKLHGFYAVIYNLPGVVASQIHQEVPDAVTVKVIAEGTIRPEVVKEIEARMRIRCGTEMRITVEQVDTLYKTAKGKVPTIVNRLVEQGSILER